MIHKLALVIPAYKATYLDATLESIAAQTCLNFQLYIGNDASPYDIASIVSKYKGRLNITYHEFTENLGGSDLVAHWARCVDMVEDEEWVWLFSDDDLMENNCVAAFYEYIGKYPGRHLLHYPVVMIDGEGNVVRETPRFPEHINVSDFFNARISYRIKSYVVEYIFRKTLYEEKGGFVNFDLAWCADDATWIKFGMDNGINTLPEGVVYWRYSGTNISHINDDKPVVIRKLNAAINYMKWAKRNLPDTASGVGNLKKIRWILGSVNNLSSFSLPFKIRSYRVALSAMGPGYYLNPLILIWCMASISFDSVKKLTGR